MPLSTVSTRRPLTSYAKVQTWIGRVVRNRRFQLNRARVRQCEYLDIGCGLNAHPGIINLDYLWHPGVDVCWDIANGGLPFADGTMRGVFSEHCLEHFSLAGGRRLLREIRRVLAPGGTVRIIVPDGGLYLQTYGRHLAGDGARPFPYQAEEQARDAWCPMVSVNRVFYQDRESPFGHCTMFDFQLLDLLLRESGFGPARQRQFGEGGDARLLLDTPDRQRESLYVEATAGVPSTP